MKYKNLANKFIGEQEDDGLSFAGIPAIAVKKFAEWLDAAEQKRAADLPTRCPSCEELTVYGSSCHNADCRWAIR